MSTLATGMKIVKRQKEELEAHVLRRHATHRLAELGTMGVPRESQEKDLVVDWMHNKPQSAQRTRWIGGAATNSIVDE